MFVKLLFSLCLTATLYGTILGVIVYLLNAILRKQVPARFRFCLWLIMALRFLVPFAPETSFSLFNAFRRVSDNSAGAVLTSAAQSSGGEGADIFLVCGIVWLCVTAALLLWFIIPQIIMRRRIARLETYDEPVFTAALDLCRARLKIKRKIRPVIQSEIETPAVCGVIRPYLLLQKDIGSMPDEEIRHIILHECCHIKRHDVASGFLLSLIRAVHWFNPLLWLFDFKARQEMEMAADERALGYMENDEHIEYGMTIINTAARFSVFNTGAAVGMSGEKSNIKRRVKSIAAFKKPAMICRVLGSAVVILVGLTCLTNAKLPEPIRPESNKLYHSITETRKFRAAERTAADKNGAGPEGPAAESGAAVPQYEPNAVSGTQGEPKQPSRSEQTAAPTETAGSGKGIVVITDAGIYSSGNAADTYGEPDKTAEVTDENDAVLFSSGGEVITASSNRLKPGTTYEDVKAETENSGRQPKEVVVPAGGSAEVEAVPDSEGDVSIYLNSESADMVSVDVYEGGTGIGRLFLKPRTFTSYTVSNLSGDGCRLSISAAALTKALIY